KPTPVQVGAPDALDRPHIEALNQDRTPGNRVRHVRGDDVVGDDVQQLVEPPQRELGPNLALVGDLTVQNEVVGRDPVGGHEQQHVLAGPATRLLNRPIQLTVSKQVDVLEPGQLNRPAHCRTEISPRWAASAMSVRWLEPLSLIRSTPRYARSRA